MPEGARHFSHIPSEIWRFRTHPCCSARAVYHKGGEPPKKEKRRREITIERERERESCIRDKVSPSLPPSLTHSLTHSLPPSPRQAPHLLPASCRAPCCARRRGLYDWRGVCPRRRGVERERERERERET